jgi:colanic acid biosynthesis glycosyl transferase WcaI
MRILIQGIDYAPVQIGVGKYTSEMAEWLARQRHEVRVITAPPFYPDWRVAEDYSGWKYRREIVNKVDVRRCPIWVSCQPGGLKRLLHLASFAVTSLPVMIHQIPWRPNVIITIEPPLFCAPQAWLTARLSGAKAWLHVQDFEVDAAFNMGILPEGRLRKIVAILEQWLMSRFDCVSSISKRMVERLRAKGVSQFRCVFFPNWVDTEKIYPLHELSAMRIELGISDDEVVVLYSGNMNRKQGIEIMTDVAERLHSDKKILFVICGSGPARIGIEEAVQKKCLKNVRFLPLQPVERLNDLLNMADIHLLPQRHDVADIVMPSKLTGMMASGRPVIATAKLGTQLAKVLNGCGLVVPPKDVSGLVEAIQLLAWDREKRNAMGRAARRYAEDNWDKEKVLTGFEKVLMDYQKD